MVLALQETSKLLRGDFSAENEGAQVVLIQDHGLCFIPPAARLWSWEGSRLIASPESSELQLPFLYMPFRLLQESLKGPSTLGAKPWRRDFCYGKEAFDFYFKHNVFWLPVAWVRSA